jgi:hypothetical protein
MKGRIFYPRRDGIQVTERIFIVDDAVYAIRGLENLAVDEARRSRPLRLWGDYLGVPTLLYESTNHTTFRQVCRALLRAVEWSRERSY